MNGRRLVLSLLSALGLALCVAAPARAVTDIQFWHAMDGALGAQLDLIVQRFNASQKDYRVVAVYKGSYDETLAAGLAARLEGKAPHILQVYDVGTVNVAVAKNAVKPVYQLMRDAGEKFDPKAFVPAVASFYSDSKGNLLSLPFNTSTPVLYVNRDAFEASGIDQQRKQIKTWYDLQEALLEVRDKARLPCGLTTTWPSWVMLENTLAWHNEEFATRNNGYDGLDAQLVFNTRLAIRHLSLMTAWSKSQIFTYSGRREEGEARFARGECVADRLLGVVRQPRARREVPFRGAAAAALRRHQRRAPQHPDGRRQPVGAERQERRRLQGRGEVLRIRVAAGSPGRVAPEDRLPADHARGIRTHEDGRLLPEVPGHRRRHPADDQRRQCAEGVRPRHPARQPPHDPCRDRRGA
jgi:hypothetical protein